VTARKPNDAEQTLYAALRSDRAVAEIIRSWRELTGGATVRDGERRTLIACSGGADSSALALALAAAAPQSIALAHIVHDLRPAEQAHADRDATKALAERLGVPFLEGAVQVRASGKNLESAARHARYKELGRLASTDFQFLATAHQGDDQLETILMRLLRGSGPRGLAGIRASRLLPGFPVRIIRPMLAITRTDAERICRIAEHDWRDDATNRDTTRLRAALRHTIIPRLRTLAPHAAQRARTTADLLADAADLIEGQAGALLAKAAASETAFIWDRDPLRREPPLVVGTALRLAAAKLTRDVGLDRLAWRLVRPVVSAIADTTTDPRRFTWRGVDVLVTAHRVELRAQS
jgi:tRNA(Ile)-lysidine synthetase-like protein